MQEWQNGLRMTNFNIFAFNSVDEEVVSDWALMMWVVPLTTPKHLSVNQTSCKLATNVIIRLLSRNHTRFLRSVIMIHPDFFLFWGRHIFSLYSKQNRVNCLFFLIAGLHSTFLHWGFLIITSYIYIWTLSIHAIVWRVTEKFQ